MVFPVSSSLLDALVLAVVSRGDTYGYKITQDVREAMEISESTLYPVLRRLQKDDCLNNYDMEYMGRNRRYYCITAKGQNQLSFYLDEWKGYKQSINKVLSGGVSDEQN